MRPLFRLAWKESRELLRARYLLPILFVPLMFVLLGQGLGGIGAELAEPPQVGVVNADDGQYGQVVLETFEAEGEVVYRGTPDEAVRAAVEGTAENGGEALVVLPANFTERIRSGERAPVRVYSTVDSVSIVSLASSERVESLLDAADRNLTLAATNATAATLSPTERRYTTFVKGERIDASPGAISAAFSTRFIFVPLVILFVILFSGQMVIVSMGIEKEHRTLESLLTMPVRRRDIVLAKLSVGAAFGLAATLLYTGSVVVYQASLSAFGTGTVGSLQLTGLDYLLVGVSLFLALLGALAVALSLGLFVDDRQGAQVLLLPLTGLALVPAMATMFADFTALSLPMQVALFAVPFTHPIIAPKQLLFDNVGLVLAGIAYEVVFVVGSVWVAARLFDSDRLVTGDAGRLGRLFDALQR